jgi:hypothetical protein
LALLARNLLRLGRQIGQLQVAAVVAGGGDDGAGLSEVVEGGGRVAFGESEAGVAEVGVGFVEAEAAAGGDAMGFIKVAAGEVEVVGVGVEGGAGEEAEGDMLLSVCTSQVIHGLPKVAGSWGKMSVRTTLLDQQMSTAHGEVSDRSVDRDIVPVCPLQNDGGAGEPVFFAVALKEKLAEHEPRN